MQNFKKTEANEFGQAIGWAVPNPLATHFLAETLQGSTVRLVALSENTLPADQLEQIWQCVSSEPDRRCWTYLSYSGFESDAELAQALQHNFGFKGSTHYLIIVNQQAVGWIGLLNERANDRVIEIGNVYFSHKMKQSTASTETIYLLLKACFDQSFRRVEWKCNSLNEPSRRAADRFGFSYEGTFRQDRISKGRNRNTDWYSILDEEWGTLEKAYLAWLKADNFDENGQQKIRLGDFVQLYKSN
ncbi:GNAT family protein [Acinetobacter gerneri]|uniref:GNAT family protein n=1 Tax=Acinetobacter gerneri TaxID=202952 RepID=A0AAW8JJ51_9GAMM|nr:GNAT family protein [Acinetobacter gerneri]MDQ9009418.1 GNAT family protein [Acinetobacter gerneri]MDQ9013380.1 GNAT family protein [Acinetobacter gerneri]MDQ9024662.1 GNAT family protein [Acinetobacter gerneri]MDQ9052052.1 GNAT family protein [Acinetobacter gerneri]MDQ9059593.1 GNAT family protein [Acinetobacter gerneri]